VLWFVIWTFEDNGILPSPEHEAIIGADANAAAPALVRNWRRLTFNLFSIKSSLYLISNFIFREQAVV
jgi:hypothetical protein